MDDIAVPQFDLRRRVALVTEASSGFGSRWARLLARAGAQVLVAARRIERLEALCEEIRAEGREAHPVALDVTGDVATAAAYDEAERVFGTVDTIFANAGTATDSSSLDLTGDEFDGVVATNLRGVFLTVRDGAKRLIAAGSAETGRGRIVIVSSITARKVYAGSAAYSASKAGWRTWGAFWRASGRARGSTSTRSCPAIARPR